MRSLILLLSSLFISSFLWAQTPTFTRTDFPRVGEVDAVTLVVEGNHKNVDEVMERIMKEDVKARKRRYRGYQMYASSRFRRISDRTLDYFFKVDREGNRDRPQAVITFLMSQGNDAFLDRDRYREEFEAAREWLTEVPQLVRMFELTQAIEEQEKAIDKELQQYDRLGRDSVDLENLLIETQRNIETNIADRVAQRDRIAEEEARLAELRALLEEEEANN